MSKSLTSKTNPQVKALSALIKQKKRRETLKLFVVEGARLCSDIISSSVEVQKAFITKNAMEKYPQQTKELIGSAKEWWMISEEVAHWVGDTKNPQGLFAICKYPDNLEDINFKPNGNYIILDDLQDPGNLGTVLRTALALGIDGAFVSADSAEVYSPKVIRGSMGAIFQLPIVRSTDLARNIKDAKQAGLNVYGAALEKDAINVTKELFLSGGVVVLGNEGNGLSKEILQLCDKSIIIPMVEAAESLNVSVAAGILMWEMLREK